MTNDLIDECRAAFEKWANEEWEGRSIPDNAWLGWQAAWKAALKTDFYEDVYDQCQELINPHIVEMRHGSACNEKSLCASVTGSLGYLVDFWLKHRSKAQ